MRRRTRIGVVGIAVLVLLAAAPAQARKSAALSMTVRVDVGGGLGGFESRMAERCGIFGAAGNWFYGDNVLLGRAPGLISGGGPRGGLDLAARRGELIVPGAGPRVDMVGGGAKSHGVDFRDTGVLLAGGKVYLTGIPRNGRSVFLGAARRTRWAVVTSARLAAPARSLEDVERSGRITITGTLETLPAFRAALERARCQLGSPRRLEARERVGRIRIEIRSSALVGSSGGLEIALAEVENPDQEATLAPVAPGVGRRDRFGDSLIDLPVRAGSIVLISCPSPGGCRPAAGQTIAFAGGVDVVWRGRRAALRALAARTTGAVDPTSLTAEVGGVAMTIVNRGRFAPEFIARLRALLAVPEGSDFTIQKFTIDLAVDKVTPA